MIRSGMAAVPRGAMVVVLRRALLVLTRRGLRGVSKGGPRKSITHSYYNLTYINNSPSNRHCDE
ncbi:hypothetical protein E2C01_077660 [Portunus trituberculatus]|uniref:Uncharacterized protein n=1 Tax=Portunus trituberculatus TaxID=210409 RepID=A0A5B7IBZ5_PORTR|nr:hypothetical protein [Portunus trituberculatus]